MTRTATTIPAILLALLVSALVLGCGGDDDGGSATPQDPAAAATETAGGVAGTDAEAGAGGEEIFEVEEAGAVTLRRDGDRLTIVSVDPAAGWTHVVSEEEPTEIEVDFLRDGRKVYEFEAELEGDRIVTKVDRDD
jgi:hypothetical protein